MNRRALLAMALAITCRPSDAAPQSAGTRHRIGWITVQQEAGVALYLAALRAGLADSGYIDGQNLRMDCRFGNDSAERVPEFAAELVRLPVELIVAHGAAVPKLHKLALPVPVIYTFSGDPVSAGFADSLARPRGNMTGITFMVDELSGKRLELVKELVPDLRRVAIIARPEHPGEPRERAVCEEVASHLGMAITFFLPANPVTSMPHSPR